MTKSVFIATYNCEKKTAAAVGACKSYLKHLKALAHKPNIIALGFQEIATILEGSFGADIDSVVEAVESTLDSYDNGGYVQSGIAQMGAILLVVYSRAELYHVDESTNVIVETGIVPRGRLYTSVKGGVGVRISYGANDVFTFICAHFAAGKAGKRNVKARNADFTAVCREIKWNDKDYGINSKQSHVFVFGDMNYRFTKDFRELLPGFRDLAFSEARDIQNDVRAALLADGRDDVLDALDTDTAAAQSEGTTSTGADTEAFSGSNKDKKSTNSETPAKDFRNESARVSSDKYYNATIDELAIEMKKNTTFTGFSEEAISFPPTYKYFEDSDYLNWKRRLSSWTDRILYRKYDGDSEHPVVSEYTALMDVKFSDHRPVILEITVPDHLPPLIRYKTGYQSAASDNKFHDIINSISDPAVGYAIITLRSKYFWYSLLVIILCLLLRKFYLFLNGY